MKIWRPYTQMHGLNEPLPKVSAAEGAYIKLESGQRCLDGISSWWVITHGHAHPEIVRAISKQAATVDQVNFANFSHQPAEALADALQDILPTQLNCMFFSDNGSTAVEVAMKMAYQACQQLGFAKKRRFLAFENSYHGDTCGAMSVSADSIFTQAYSDMRWSVLRARQGQLQSDSNTVCLENFYKLIENHKDELAAVIIEPLIQGAGGMIVWPPQLVKDIARKCHEAGVFLIFDEVMTGFGRTGTMFAFESIGVIPDFLCLSKGLTGGVLPMGLTVTTDAIYEAFLSDKPDRMLFHGHSFTANAISCAAACANLEIFKNDKTIEKIAKINLQHKESLAKFKDKASVKDIRAIGGIGIVQIEHAKFCYGSSIARDFTRACLKHDLFIRPLGSVIYIMPPYCVELAELDRAWSVVSHVLSEFIEP